MKSNIKITTHIKSTNNIIKLTVFSCLIATTLLLQSCGGGGGGGNTPAPDHHPTTYNIGAHFVHASTLSNEKTHTITLQFHGCGQPSDKKTLDEKNGSYSFKTSDSCTLTLKLNNTTKSSPGYTMSIDSHKHITGSQRSWLETELNNKEESTNYREYVTLTGGTSIFINEKYVDPSTNYPITFNNSIDANSIRVSHIRADDDVKKGNSIYVMNSDCFDPHEVISGFSKKYNTKKASCDAKIELHDNSTGIGEANFHIEQGKIKTTGEEIANDLKHGVRSGKKLKVTVSNNPTTLTFSYNPPPTPPSNPVHSVLTTNFANVGTPTGGCGLPAAPFHDNKLPPTAPQKIDNVDSAFNELELGLPEGSTIAPRFSNNYIALNIEDTPITSNNTWMSEGNSIISKYLDKYVNHPRPMGNKNSGNGQLAHYATLAGDWDDGLNCGRYVKLNLIDDDGSKVWVTDPALNKTDNSGGQTGALATIDPADYTAGSPPEYTSYFIVDDSCQDDKTACRGFTDTNKSYPKYLLPLSATKDHIDLHSWGTMYKPADTSFNQGFPMAEWDAKKNGKKFLIPGYADQNYYVSWQYAPNPYWTDNDKPVIALGSQAKSYSMPIVFSHLQNGIHGITYCKDYDLTSHSCGSSWIQAKMFNDNGQSYLLNKIDTSETTAVRIIDADDNESNYGSPYTFKLNDAKDTMTTGIIQANINGYLSHSSVDCSQFPGSPCQITDQSKFKGQPATYVQIPQNYVSNDTDYTTKKLSFTLNPTKIDSGTNSYTKFEKAEICLKTNYDDTTGCIKKTVIDPAKPEDTLNYDKGYHGLCDLKTNKCNFYVPSSVLADKYKLSILGDVTVDETRSVHVKSEKQLISGDLDVTRSSALSATLSNIKVNQTLFTSYVPIQFTFSGSKAFTPEDTDILYIGIKDSEGKASNLQNQVATYFGLGAPDSIAVPFNGSDYTPGTAAKGALVMYEMPGDGTGNYNLDLSLEGNDPNVPKPAEGDKPITVPYGQLKVDDNTTSPTIAYLHYGSFETTVSTNATHGITAKATLGPGQTQKTLSFNNGVLSGTPGGVVTYAYTLAQPNSTHVKVNVKFSDTTGGSCTEKYFAANSHSTIHPIYADLDHPLVDLKPTTQFGYVPVNNDTSTTPSVLVKGGMKFLLPPQDAVVAFSKTNRCEASYNKLLNIPPSRTSMTEKVTYSKQHFCEFSEVKNDGTDDHEDTISIQDNFDLIPAAVKGKETPVRAQVQFNASNTPPNPLESGWYNAGLNFPGHQDYQEKKFTTLPHFSPDFGVLTRPNGVPQDKEATAAPIVYTIQSKLMSFTGVTVMLKSNGASKWQSCVNKSN